MNESLIQSLIDETLPLINAKRPAMRALILNQIRALHGPLVAQAVREGVAKEIERRVNDGQKKSRPA